MVYTCGVPGCGRSNREIRLHSLPNDLQRAREWCQLMQRSDLLPLDLIALKKKCRICDRHFHDSAKFPSDAHNRTNLKADCKPTLYLPGRDEEEFLEDPRPSTSTSVDNESVLPSIGQGVFNETSKEESCGDEATLEPDAKSPKVLRVPGDLKPIPATKKSKKQRELLKRKNDETENKRVNCVLIGNGIRRRNLLHTINMHKVSQLTPKKRHLYNLAKEYMAIGRDLEAENITNKERLEKIIELTESGKLFGDHVNLTTYRFLRSQVSQQQFKSRGRRFSLDDKLLALLLLKQSPKGYKLLRKIFALPSRKTLLMLLRQVPFGCGINASIMKSLERAVSSLDEHARHYVLAFDEISLTPALFLNQREDVIDGLVDDGEKRTERLADHAMVFMLKGVAKSWKQPVAYFFSENGMKSYDVAHHIKSVVQYATDIGLKVVASVCDQYNKSAINALVAETIANAARRGKAHERYSFVVGEQEVVPLFDPPHLLKGIRNNMLNGDVHYRWRNESAVAKWEHIVALYELDGDTGPIQEDDIDVTDYRMLNRLTDAHIYEAKMKKMKVKLAAQVFSQRVSSIMRKFARLGDDSLPPEAEGTANFLLFVDRLFDSVNASVINTYRGKNLSIQKPLRCAVQANTSHIAFWLEAKQVLQSISFVSGNRSFVPPTITNWIITLDGFIDLWRSLSKVGFTFLLTRNFNQDALENFFGAIRSHGARNVNPSCSSFRSSFKSMIITNFVSPHSPGANCEEDKSDGAPTALGEFLKVEDTMEGIVDMDVAHDDCSPNFSFRTVTRINILEVETYLAGHLGRKILKQIRCKICRANLVATEEQNAGVDDVLNARRYGPKALLRPKTRFSTLFSLCYQVVHFYTPKLIAVKNIRARLLFLLQEHINNFMGLTCKTHDLFSLFLKYFLHFYMLTYADNVNKILAGQSTKNMNDPIKLQAWARSKKFKRKEAALRSSKHLV